MAAEEPNLASLSDLCTPWCLHTVATLRIAEHIAAGKMEIGELAEAAGCDAYGRVVVLGGVSPDHEPRGLEIEMVLVGGRGRTVAEFRELALEAGLEVVEAGRERGGPFVVECRLAG